MVGYRALGWLCCGMEFAHVGCAFGPSQSRQHDMAHVVTSLGTVRRDKRDGLSS